MRNMILFNFGELYLRVFVNQVKICLYFIFHLHTVLFQKVFMDFSRKNSTFIPSSFTEHEKINNII